MNGEQIEIEKKFLVTNDDWHSEVKSSFTIYQGYYSDNTGENKRIRLVLEDKKAIIGFKQDIGEEKGFIKRIEIEKKIEYLDGLLLLFKCKKFLVKKRHLIDFNNKCIEVDVFQNLKSPLTMAEIEISKNDLKDTSFLKFPSWLDKDVSNINKYRNFNLIRLSEKHDFYLKELLKDNSALKLKS